MEFPEGFQISPPTELQGREPEIVSILAHMAWKCSICPIASPRTPPVQGWHGGFAREFPGDPSQECVCQPQGLTSASAQECPTDLVDCPKKLQEHKKHIINFYYTNLC